MWIVNSRQFICYSLFYSQLFTIHNSHCKTMALQGCLHLGGREYGIVECSYEFSQSVDDTGKPVSRPQGGTITFVMPATSDDDLFFYKWMFNKSEVKSGYFRFTVFTSANKPSCKTVYFTNAYCIGLRDFFNDNDSRLMHTTITISAEIITIGSSDTARFTNEWT